MAGLACAAVMVCAAPAVAQADPPQVVSESASNVTADGVTFNAVVNFHGNQPTQGVVFEYGVGPNYYVEPPAQAYGPNGPARETATPVSCFSPTVSPNGPPPPGSNPWDCDQTVSATPAVHGPYGPGPADGFDALAWGRWSHASSDGNFTAPLPRVSPTLTLHYRAVLPWSGGVVYGPDQTVTSAPPSRAPSATTGPIVRDPHSGLYLTGTLNDHGQGYSFIGFQFGPTASYGFTCPGYDPYWLGQGVPVGPPTASGQYPPPSSEGDHQVGLDCLGYPENDPSGLFVLPDHSKTATVHYRIVADNGFGSPVYGEDRTVTVPGGSNPSTALNASLTVPPTTTAASILRAGGFPAPAVAPAAGVMQIAWYYLPRGAHLKKRPKPVVVVSGSRRFNRAGSASIKLRLTSQGRALLRRSRGVRLTAVGSFTPRHGRRTTRRQSISIRH